MKSFNFFIFDFAKEKRMDEKLTYITKQAELIIESKDQESLKDFLDSLNISEVEAIIDEIPEYSALIISTMSLNRAISVFGILDEPTQFRIIKKLPRAKIAEIIRGLPPDDRTSFFASLDDPDQLHQFVSLLSPEDRKEVFTLLSYPEDSVGRLMTPDFLAIEKNLTVKEALDYIRQFGKSSETIDVIYILDERGVLIDDLRIKQLLIADPSTFVYELMDDRLIYLNAFDSYEDAIKTFKMNNRVALPVIDSQGVLLGIVTIDDILWVADEEYSEDMQLMGGTAALDEPYLDLPIHKLIWKRAGWLIVLFLGELLTASVMQHYEEQVARMVFLTTFLPLMISSGGNSGSQASTLVIQAMATGEVKIKHWYRVFKREIVSGLSLGIILGIVGFLRILIWHNIYPELYGDTWYLVAITVSLSLVGIVSWGSLIGSMLPFLLKKLGQDPATSSAPFVATIVDVTGLIIYLGIAGLVIGELIS